MMTRPFSASRFEATKKLLFGLKENTLKLEEVKECALHADLDARDSKGNTALHLTLTEERGAEDKIVKIMELLIMAGVEVDGINENWESPLVWAVYLGLSAVARFLIKSGANKDIKVQGDDNYLQHYAAASGVPRMMEFLWLECKANFEVSDGTGRTPLMYAAEKGEIHSIKWLIFHGVDIMRKDDTGENALFKAVRYQQDKAVWALLEVHPYKQLHSINNSCVTLLDFSEDVQPRLYQQLKRLAKREHHYFHSAFDRLTKNKYRIHTPKWTAFKCKFFFVATQALVSVQTVLYFFSIDVLFSIFLLFMQFLGSILYLNLLYSDPGYIPKGLKNYCNRFCPQEVYLSHCKYRAYEKAVREAENAKVCVTCKTIVPPRSKHCKEIDRCVLRYDHYCPYIGTVVGQENHALFLFFLLWFLLVFILYFWLSSQLWGTFLEGNMDYVMTHIIKALIATTSGAACVIMALFNLWLFLVHLYLVWINLTTNEYINFARYDYLLQDGEFKNFYDRGPCINCFEFWCGWFRMRPDDAHKRLIPAHEAIIPARECLLPA